MLPDNVVQPTTNLVLTRLVSKPSYNKEVTSNSQVIKRNISIARQDNNMGYPMPYPK